MGRRRTHRAFPPSWGIVYRCRVVNGELSCIGMSSKLSLATIVLTNSHGQALRRVLCLLRGPRHLARKAYLKQQHDASAPTNFPHPTSRTHPIPHSLSFFLIPHEHHVTLPCSLPPSRTPLHSIVYRPSRVGYDVPAHSCQLTGPLSQRASCARVRSYDPTSPSWPTTTT